MPTLVVLWSRNGEAVSNLQASVTRRLSDYSKIGALKWAGPFSSGEGLSGEELVRTCESLLAWDLWRCLVERGYQPGLPGPGSPASIQVVFVVDSIGGEADGLPMGILGEVQKSMKGRADLRSVLVWLGRKPEPSPEDLNLYWPRFRMEPVAAGGITTVPQRVWEVTEHLLVALMGSDLVRKVNIQKEEAEWLVMGASALLPHPRVEEWLREAVLGEILGSLIAPLPEAESERIEKAMAEYARSIREEMLETAQQALRESRWEIRVQGLAVGECVLQNPAMRRALFGPYQGGIATEKFTLRDWKRWPSRILTLISALTEPFLPDQRFGEALYDHYRELTEKLEQWLDAGKWRGLVPLTLEKYHEISLRLGAFLDRGLLARTPERGPSWWFTEPPWPTGLSAALMALLALEKYLCEEGDIKDARGLAQEWVSPEPLLDEPYLRAAGDTDAMMVRGSLQRYAHFARTLASPWGVLLCLLPAWPLATFLVQVIARWEPAQAILVTGLALLVIGVAELVYWWLLKARKLLKAVQQEAYGYLTGRILRLAARVIRDYRYWMLGQLREAEVALTDLYGTLLQRYEEARKSLQALESLRPQVEGNTYILVDTGEIRDWKNRALDDVRKYPAWLEGIAEEERGVFDSAVTALLVQKFWPLPERPTSAIEVVKELERGVTKMVRENAPTAAVWKAGVLAERMKSLKDGRRWEWLWQHAHPLGNVESPGGEFVFILSSGELFEGSTGRGSKYWRSDWQEVPFQGQEEICFRVLVEQRRGE
ncbi:MAG: hypothetical protein ACPLTQ_08320 [Anaerolineae bacterium]